MVLGTSILAEGETQAVYHSTDGSRGHQRLSREDKGLQGLI